MAHYIKSRVRRKACLINSAVQGTYPLNLPCYSLISASLFFISHKWKKIATARYKWPSLFSPHFLCIDHVPLCNEYCQLPGKLLVHLHVYHKICMYIKKFILIGPWPGQFYVSASYRYSCTWRSSWWRPSGCSSTRLCAEHVGGRL